MEEARIPDFLPDCGDDAQEGAGMTTLHTLRNTRLQTARNSHLLLLLDPREDGFLPGRRGRTEEAGPNTRGNRRKSSKSDKSDKTALSSTFSSFTDFRTLSRTFSSFLGDSRGFPARITQLFQNIPVPDTEAGRPNPGLLPLLRLFRNPPCSQAGIPAVFRPALTRP